MSRWHVEWELRLSGEFIVEADSQEQAEDIAQTAADEVASWSNFGHEDMDLTLTEEDPERFEMPRLDRFYIGSDGALEQEVGEP